MKLVLCLNKEAMNVVIQMMKENEIEHLREEFRRLDKDYTGTISAKELEAAIRSQGKEVTANEIKQIINKVDYIENGKINYSEFLAATIDRKYLERDKNAKAIFRHFDTKNEGKITTESLRKALLRGIY